MERNRENIRSTDRILMLEVLDGEKPLSSTGLADPRLFTGENRLHAVMDRETMLWNFKYDMGGLPPQLKDMRFTSFDAMLKHAGDYLKKRNIRIKEVID